MDQSAKRYHTWLYCTSFSETEIYTFLRKHSLKQQAERKKKKEKRKWKVSNLSPLLPLMVLFHI